MQITGTDIVQIVTVLLGPTGAAWIGVKGALNGMRAKIENTEKTVEKLDGKVDALDAKLGEHIQEHRTDRASQEL